MKTYISIDNGTTGTVAVIKDNFHSIIHTPIKMEQSYTKTKQNISRLDYRAFYDFLDSIDKSDGCFITLERPMINPIRFVASISAARCLEAELIAIENLKLPFRYIDSREWQKEMLPGGLKGAPELKKASMDVGCRLFPNLQEFFKKQKDADSILMCEYSRRKNF